MGGGSSRTRRITLENEDHTSVIKVSDDVVQRLKGYENQAPVSNIQSPQPPWNTFPGGLPPELPPNYFYGPSLTSLQCRQEKTEELKKNDEYWEKRITDLEKVHKEMHKVMEYEYQKAIQEVENTNKKLYPCDVPPCQVSKKKVIECYKMYPNQSMKCLKEVEAFAQCVDVQRATLISNKG